MNTAAIGGRHHAKKGKSIKILASDLAEMKATASPRLMPLLNIRILGSSTAQECLQAIDRLPLQPVGSQRAEANPRHHGAPQDGAQ